MIFQHPRKIILIMLLLTNLYLTILKLLSINNNKKNDKQKFQTNNIKSFAYILSSIFHYIL